MKARARYANIMYDTAFKLVFGSEANKSLLIELLEALKRFHGNRDRTAAYLGISKTTLWRRMKQCGIGRDLSVR